MSEPLPLPIWPQEMSEDRLNLLRKAKAALNTDITVLPCPAVPGSPGRVLAFGQVPPFFCDSVLIAPANVDNLESVRNALSFLLTAGPGEKGLFEGESWLRAVMGVNVTFRGEESTVAFRDTSVRQY